MNFSLSKDVKTNWEQYLKDVVLKVWYQQFSAHVGGHRMLTFLCNVWFDKEHKAHIKNGQACKT